MPDDATAVPAQTEPTPATLKARNERRLIRIRTGAEQIKKILSERDAEIALHLEKYSEAKKALEEAEQPIKEAIERSGKRLEPLYNGLKRNAELFRVFTEEHPELVPQPPHKGPKTIQLTSGVTYLKKDSGNAEVVVDEADAEDAAVIAEIKGFGWSDLLTVKTTLNRKAIGDKQNRDRVEQLTKLRLHQSTRHEIRVVDTPFYVLGRSTPSEEVVWEICEK
ncbi:MAG: host-nuclease inhibitor Gam family protein [Patescibacteria group bacterium]